MALEHLLPVSWPDPSRSPSSFNNSGYKSSFSGQIINVKEFLFAWKTFAKKVACERKKALINTLEIIIRPQIIKLANV
jgi:hypothetical protein